MRGRAAARPIAGVLLIPYHDVAASMRGRAAARPIWPFIGPFNTTLCFNEGAGSCPPDPGYPAQHAGTILASMRGRAAARPILPCQPTPPKKGQASMRGRAAARPIAGRRRADNQPDDASMRGRAAARPIHRRPNSSIPHSASFNEGAGSCPPDLAPRAGFCRVLPLQ